MHIPQSTVPYLMLNEIVGGVSYDQKQGCVCYLTRDIHMQKEGLMCWKDSSELWDQISS